MRQFERLQNPLRAEPLDLGVRQRQGGTKLARVSRQTGAGVEHKRTTLVRNRSQRRDFSQETA